MPLIGGSPVSCDHPPYQVFQGGNQNPNYIRRKALMHMYIPSTASFPVKVLPVSGLCHCPEMKHWPTKYISLRC